MLAGIVLRRSQSRDCNASSSIPRHQESNSGTQRVECVSNPKRTYSSVDNSTESNASDAFLVGQLMQLSYSSRLVFLGAEKGDTVVEFQGWRLTSAVLIITIMKSGSVNSAQHLTLSCTLWVTGLAVSTRCDTWMYSASWSLVMLVGASLRSIPWHAKCYNC